jgi:hypothetical protein
MFCAQLRKLWGQRLPRSALALIAVEVKKAAFAAPILHIWFSYRRLFEQAYWESR